MGAFVHLHVHSYYSLLEACNSPRDLAQAAAQAGMPALALTDHNALYGAVEFYQACREAGIQPIVGMELDLEVDASLRLAPGSDPHSGDSDSLVLLARNREGYANLCRLSSNLQTRPDRDAQPGVGLPVAELEGRVAGLIALSGGKRGRLQRLVREGRVADAQRVTSAWADLFGPDRFLVELQILEPGDAKAARELAALAERLGLGTVATRNVHYLLAAEAPQCRLLSALKALQPLEQMPQRLGLHLAPPAEMEAAFSGHPEALASTVAIAQQCHLELPLGSPIFPEIELPPGQTAGDLLRAETRAGAGRRYGTITSAVRDRLDRELAIIDDMGYAPLFLIVADVVAYAREHGIPANLRGSAAGSAVLYCLGVSAVDPIALDLYFERFLNPERRDPPDVDLDLCSRRRDEVIRYIYRRYGRERVATICTYSRLRARSAWREVAKAYRLPQDRIDAIARQVPRYWHPGMGPEVEAAKERLLAAAASPGEREALAAAWALDGHPRHLSVHPGGVVIAPGPLTDWVPLQWASKGIVITQYDLYGIEQLGLVKIDLLGIRALTVVADTIERIQRGASTPEGKPDAARNGGRSGFVRDAIQDRDPAAGDLMSRADTIGCFQIESPGMRRTLRELGTRSLEDVTVTLALYKPGPLQGGLKDAFVRRHHGREPARYLHPSLEPVLRSTYGVVLYQEQVLRIVHELAGFSLGEADRLRRAIGHLGHGDEMMPLREAFIERVGQSTGMPTEVATRLWELLASFAGYGFLKSHAASYAAVAYQTAFLKAHYPAEFMTAILRNWGGYYPQHIYLSEARRMGLEVHPPHINHSGRRFELEIQPGGQPHLWMGLGQVRGLTRRTIAAILAARRDGPFTSLRDLLRRARPRPAEAENLVKAGGLDRLGPGRAALLADLRGPWQAAGTPFQLALPLTWEDRGEVGDAAPKGAGRGEETLLDRLRMEKEMLGWPVSAHPLEPFASRLTARGAVPSNALPALAGSQRGGGAAVKVMVGGVRLGLWGERRGSVTLEDQAGMFAVRRERGRRLPLGPLGELGPYLVEGWVQGGRSGEASVVAERIEPLT